MEAEEVVNELVYSNYAYNRLTFPDRTPQQWRLVYGPSVDRMEQRYQAEHKVAA